MLEEGNFGQVWDFPICPFLCMKPCVRRCIANRYQVDDQVQQKLLSLGSSVTYMHCSICWYVFFSVSSLSLRIC